MPVIAFDEYFIIFATLAHFLFSCLLFARLFIAFRFAHIIISITPRHCHYFLRFFFWLSHLLSPLLILLALALFSFAATMLLVAACQRAAPPCHLRRAYSAAVDVAITFIAYLLLAAAFLPLFAPCH